MSTPVAGQSVPASRSGPVATVRLSAQFVNRLTARIRKSPPAPAPLTGLLFGSPGRDVTIVQAFKSIPVLEGSDSGPLEGERLERIFKQALSATLSDPEVAALELIGWYSFRETGGLQPADIAFQNAHFSRPADLALILKREDSNELLLEFYTSTESEPISPTAYHWGALRLPLDLPAAGSMEIGMRSIAQPQIPLDEPPALESPIGRRSRRAGLRTRIPLSILRSEPDAEPRSREAESHDARIVRRRPSVLPKRDPAPERALPTHIQAGAAPSVPVIYYAAPPPTRRWTPWVFSILLCALAAAATFAFLLARASGNATPQFLQVLLPPSGLQLRAEGQGDRLLVSWNRRNAVVRSASDAVLHIDDGAQHRDVPLDASQVANGLVLYRPASNDVTFRLEIHGQQGSTLGGTVRVLDGLEQAAADLSQIPDVSAPSAPRAASPRPAPPREHTRTIPRVKEPENPSKPAASPDTPPAREARTRPAAHSAAPPILVGPGSSTPASSDAASSAPIDTAAPPPQSTAGPSAAPPAADTAITETPAPSQSAATPTEIGSAQPAQQSFVPPRPTRQVLPEVADIPAKTLRTTPRVEIEVQVDDSGHVASARLIGPRGKIKQPLAGAALDAAKQWVFEPARLHGQPVASTHTIIFEFQSQ